MPDFRVDSIYDIGAIQEEQAKFLAFLAEAKAALIDLNNQRINLKGTGVSSFTQASQELNKTINDSNSAIKNVTVTSTEYNKQLALSSKTAKEAAQTRLLEAKAILEQEKADAIRTKSLIAQEKELDRLIKLEEKKNSIVVSAPTPIIDGGSRFTGVGQDATSEQTAAFEKLRQAEADASIAAAEYGQSVNQGLGGVKIATSSDLELAKARNAVTKANSIQNVELQGLNAQRLLANKAAKEEALTALGLLGPYQLLEKEFAAAALNAKDLAVQYGVNSVQAKAAAATALELNTQLQTIDKTVGQSQKNVGNYAQGVTKGLTTFYNGLRKIAYLIPGIGIGGLVLLLISPLTDLYKWLTKDSDATVLLAEKTKLYNDVMKQADQNAGKEIADLKILYSATQNVNLSTAERAKSAKKLQDLWPETFKNMSTENILLGNAKTGYDELTVSILKNAQAKAAASEIEKLEGQRLDALNQKLKIQNATENESARAQKTKYANTGIGQNAQVFKENALNAITERRTKALKEQDKVLGNIDAKEKFLIDLVGAGNLADNIPDPKKRGKGSNSLSELKDRLNTEFDIYKIAQEARIKLFKDDTTKEGVYYLDKLTALDNYVKAEKELLDKEEQYKINLAKIAAARETQKLQESKVGKSGSEQERINQNIVITQQNLEQEILLIKATYADKGNTVILGAADTRNDIIKNHLKIEEELYAEASKIEQDTIDKDNERIKKGFETRAKLEEEAAKKKIELLQELHQKEGELAVTAENFLYSLATAGFERQLNLITDESTAITKRKDEELAANDVLVQSAEQKAANVILINSRAQTQQDALDRKSAEIKNKQAQFERAQQIFEIGVNTIKALAAIKLQAAILLSNPLTAVLASIALAQIPLVLGTAALSIGAILAQPLPHYKYGRGEKGEEFAIVGDGGVNEYIMRGTGKIEKTPSVNTLTHLMPKDRVYPNKEALMRELMMNNMQLSNYSVGQDGAINKNDIERLGSRLEDSIGSIKIQTQLVTKSGWRNHNKRISDYDAWVNRVIKN